VRKKLIGLLVAGVLTLVVAGCSAETQPATNITATQATLHSKDSCQNGDAGTWYFKYRKVGASSWTSGPSHNWTCPSGGATNQDLSQQISGLDKYTDYEYKICGTLNGSGELCWDRNGDSDSVGNYDTFNTTSGPYLASSSPWKTDLSGGVTLDSHSANWANAIHEIANADYDAPGSFYNRGDWNAVQLQQSNNNGVPIWKAKPTDPVKTITITTNQPQSEKDLVTSIHIPAGATPAPGSDHHFVVWNPSADLMIGCFDTTVSGGNYSAERCEGTEHAATAQGYVGTGDDSNFSCSPCWGSTGTGLPVAAGVITLGDLITAENGGAHSLNHALAISLPANVNIDGSGLAHSGTVYYGNNNSLDLDSGTAGSQTFAFPAQEHDGQCTYSTAHCFPEGMKVQVDPSFNCTSGTGTGGHPDTIIGEVLCLTMQKYGAIDRDSNGGAIQFYADPHQDYTGYIPANAAWDQILDPDHFPWADLQIVAPDHYCSGTPC
jgi:hypothetical protein